MENIFSFLSGGIVGGFLGGFAKFFWEKWLPDRMTWQRQQEVERDKLMSQLRAPALAAIYDLQSRIYVIAQKQAANYEYVKRMRQEEYYVDSTTFLVAQCFAWLGALRKKMATFDYAALFTRLEGVSKSFAGGQPGFQLFWLEQREIGERMLRATDATDVQCMGYSEFLDSLRTKATPSCFSSLRKKVAVMREDWPKEVVRLTRIQHALVETVNFIDPDARWVPQNRRDRLSVEKIIERLVADKLVSKEKAEKLTKEACERGLIQGAVV